MRRRSLVLLVLIASAACAHQPVAPSSAAPGTFELVAASPADGFNFPYILRLPAGAVSATTWILVEPNNTGAVSDDFNVHLEAARKLAATGVGAFVAKRLDLPLLMPVFPRSATDWQTYSHIFDRDTMLKTDSLERVDLQLLAMVRHARLRLRASGVPAHEQFLMTGFSASGSFSNRFTVLHPRHVKAVAAGGLNALLMVPAATLEDTPLPFPLGTADIRAVTGNSFDAEAWRKVPQYIYMGAKDDNDAVLYDDGYSEDERKLVFRLLGEKMQPDRWTNVQHLYGRFGANAKFATHVDVGHWTTQAMNEKVAEFFREQIGVKP